tara:strand:- start:824 stop:1228 length:405 start_codon:yes stop_codon:yes gene_type:complete
MAKKPKKPEQIVESQKLSRKERNSVESVVGNMYTFTYKSATANEGHPVILNVRRRGGNRLFQAKGNTYMAGITLNSLDTGSRQLIIEKLGEKRKISYSMIKRLRKVFKANYRVYNFTKMQHLSLIDIDIYLETL